MRYATSLVLALLSTLGCGGAPNPEIAPAAEEAPTTLELAVVSGQAPRASGGFPSVVVLEPSDEIDAGAPPREPPVMDQFGVAFRPPVLVARIGERVSFRNSEDVLHNVHVKDTISGETIFNVGTIPYGSYEHRFEAPGVYDVSCNIHPAMAAFVVVTVSPHAVAAEPDGSFALSGVPAGRYDLTVWNVDSDRRLEQPITVEAPGTELELLPTSREAERP